MLDQKQFALALKQICQEKGISEEQVMETIESALAAAYRKDYGNKQQNIKVKFNPETGDMDVVDVKTVVEDLPEEAEEEKQETKEKESEEETRKFNPKTEIQLSEAKKIKKDVKVGDELIIKLPKPHGFGRMAAQTAKQVIIQKLREAERNTLYEEMKKMEGKVVNGIVEKYDKRFVTVNIGKASAVLPPEEQVKREMYRSGMQMKFYIIKVEQTPKGPYVLVSRRSPEIIKELFYSEIPEVAGEIVEIKGIAREAGERSKVAVYTEDESIDPIGSCIGQKGTRIQTIINELGGEKIDIIQYDEDIETYIKNSLSPAKITSLELDEKNKEAVAFVKPDQFSLAIGKAGQNVRLAAKLTGWKIDVKEIGKEESASEEESAPAKDDKNKEGEKTEESAPEKDDKKEKTKKKEKSAPKKDNEEKESAEKETKKEAKEKDK